MGGERSTEELTPADLEEMAKVMRSWADRLEEKAKTLRDFGVDSAVFKNAKLMDRGVEHVISWLNEAQSLVDRLAVAKARGLSSIQMSAVAHGLSSTEAKVGSTEANGGESKDRPPRKVRSGVISKKPKAPNG